MQNDPIWAYNQMAKMSSDRRKKPKIDLWEITGCAEIQEMGLTACKKCNFFPAGTMAR
jgi:hypothetical protein